jgi:pimeloyl-ACP methyl ester carboxylesterase
METVASADGTPIAVWRSGDGPPLVLIHGTSADHGRWAPVLPAFEERFTVLAMDRRGRGGSGDAEDYALEREVEDVVAVVEAAGSSVRVLGHSYGAGCALEAALRTECIAELVLYEPPLGFVVSPPEIGRRLAELLAAGERDELVAFFMREVAGATAEQLEALRSLPAWEARLAAAHTIPREERVTSEYVFDPGRFRTMRVPTLFLLGGDSIDPFKAAADAIEEALPDCRLVVMPGQRHVAMDTATELFVTEVLAFLDA